MHLKHNSHCSSCAGCKAALCHSQLLNNAIVSVTTKQMHFCTDALLAKCDLEAGEKDCAITQQDSALTSDAMFFLLFKGHAQILRVITHRLALLDAH